MKLRTFLMTIVLSVSLQTAFSQASSKFSINSYINGKGDTLLYRQLFPDADTLRRFPLVIFLHGSGERGNDNEAQLKWGAMNFASDENMIRYPAFVIAPQCPSNISWSNFTRDRNSTQMSLEAKENEGSEFIILL
jgi:predicted peptidase